MEWIVASIPLVIAVVGLGVNLFLDRKNKADRTYDIWTPPTTKRVLTARQRSDLYQDMDWWDREFRKLSGEPEPLEVDGFVGSMAYWAQEVQNRLSNLGTAPKDLVELNQLNASGVLTTQEYIKHIKDKLEID